MDLLLDVMCGGLVPYLRMCGHDAAYAGERERDLAGDDEILAVAGDEDRTLLTRDVDLSRRADEAILLESRDVEAQLAELADAGVDLELADEPAVCGSCNGPLERVDPSEPTPDYAPAPDETDVWRCRDCGQHFWRGSHWDRVRETLARVRSHADDGSDGAETGSDGAETGGDRR